MSANLIDYTTRVSGVDRLEPLAGYLLSLVGEPFLLARVSYADELTFHFGARRDAAHPRLRKAGIAYGSFVLLTRGSAWLVKSGVRPVLAADGFVPLGMSMPGRPLTHQDIASGGLVSEGATVVLASPFFVPEFAYGLQIRFSDGSALVLLPTEQEDGDGPPVADWELVMPQGTLRVGPGRRWDLEPRAATR